MKHVGWGTDNKRLINTLGDISSSDRARVSARFPDLYNKSLTKLMKDECGNNDFGVAAQYLSVGPVEAECMMLKNAMRGIGPIDPSMLYSILCGRSNRDMLLLKKTYFKMYTKDLTAEMSKNCSGDLKTILMSACQAAEEEFDPDYHTEDKAMKDAEILYNVGEGRMGTDEHVMIKIVVLSPPKYLRIVNSVYCDLYGCTLMKAFELELKQKPYDTIATLIKKSTKGIGIYEPYWLLDMMV